MEQLTDFQRFIKVNKLKQKQVADFLETSPQYVNQVAKGKCALSDDKYEKLVQSNWDISMLDIPSYIKVPANDNFEPELLSDNADTRHSRLRKVYDYLVFRGVFKTQLEFAEMLGTNNTNLSSAMNGNEKYLSDSLFHKINANFPEINLEWLLSGTGSMLQTGVSIVNSYSEFRNTINQRIAEVVNFLIFSKAVLNQQDLSQKLGYNASSFSQIINGHTPVSDKFINKIISFAPYVNAKWLITGDGAMFRELPESLCAHDASSDNAYESDVNIDISKYPAKVVEEIKAEVVEEIREEVRAEIAEEIEPKFAPLEIARKPNLDTMEWIKKGSGRNISSTFNMMAILQDTHFYTEVRSNAMSPALTQGEVLFLQPFEDGYLFIDGHPYAVETKSRGLIVFYLYDRGEYVECRPHNVEFGTLTIPKDDIIRYYKILFHGSTWIETSLPRGGCQQQVAKQSEQISTLIGELGKAGDRVDKMGEQVSRVLDMMEKKL